MMRETGKTVAILVFDGVQPLDVAAPLDAFSAANAIRPGAYAPIIAGLDAAPVTSETGLRMVPTARLDSLGGIDTLIIPGGAGLREDGMAESIAAAIQAAQRQVRRLVSVCTGIYGLAPTGLLDGLRVTTHWRFAEDVAARFPMLRVEPDALYIREGRIYTAAGVTAALDLSLALIEADHGAAAALAVARDLIVYVKRTGGQQQYSEPLRFQSRAAGPFGDLADWITTNLSRPLTTEVLADRVHLSPRQFTRRFGALFGTSPAHYIERLRLDAGRHKLNNTGASIGEIALAVGFSSPDVFSRAFQRCFGLQPSEYRQRFSFLSEDRK